jgi:hypothetical protein
MPKEALRPMRYPLLGADQKEMLEFSLSGLFPADQGHLVTLNIQLGTLAHLMIEQNRPHMVTEQQFTTGELYVLIPLLQAYPYYCPHEQLYASFTCGSISEEVVSQCRQQLEEASLSGEWDQFMRPIRNTLSRMRTRLSWFGIRVSSIPETGYVLMSKPGRQDVQSYYPQELGRKTRT